MHTNHVSVGMVLGVLDDDDRLDDESRRHRKRFKGRRWRRNGGLM